MNSRRDFLKHLGPIVAAGSALTVASVAEAKDLNSDDFHCRNWRVKWSGWQRPCNQMVVCGFWAAFHPEQELGFFQTTAGENGQMRDLDVVPMCAMKGWPRPTLMELDTPEKLEAVKRRAKLALLKAIF